jgi:heavy metal sensor kinase
MRLSLNLRAKLALLFSLTFAVVWGTSGAILYQATRIRAAADFDAHLVHLCTGLWGYLQFAGDNQRPKLVYDAEEHEVAYFIADASRYYQLYDAKTGRVLLQSRDSTLMDLALPRQEVLRLVEHPDFDEKASSQHIFRFRSAVYHAAQQPYLLRVGESLDDLLTGKSRFLKILLLFVPLATLVAAASGWWIAAWALRPLRELKNAVDKINITQLDRRLPLRGTRDELEEVSQAVNEALARLDVDLRQMKQFTAYMSHELRTPLTVLRGEAEIALLHSGNGIPAENWRQLLTSQLEEFDKLERLIRRFLLLTRAEAGEFKFEMEPLDVCALAASLGKETTPLALRRGISLRTACEAEARVTADWGWIERAILNLLDNAIKFTGEGGKIQIAARPVGDHAVVEVSDTGCGIAEAALPHIFDCFYRATDLRPTRPGGVGLGLALTKWIIEKHGGVVQSKSRVGVGSVFTIILPLLAPDASKAAVTASSLSTTG